MTHPYQPPFGGHAMYPFVWLYLPYVLLAQPDGRYLVANRKYLPIGLSPHAHAELGVVDTGSDSPPPRWPESCYCWFPRPLSDAQVRSISATQSQRRDRIYLWDDDAPPHLDPAYWQAYSQRLAHLAHGLMGVVDHRAPVLPADGRAWVVD